MFYNNLKCNPWKCNRNGYSFSPEIIDGNLCPCHIERKIVDFHASLNQNNKEAELICCNITNQNEIDSCSYLNNKEDELVVTGLTIENSPIFKGHLVLGQFFTKFQIDVQVSLFHDEIILELSSSIKTLYIMQTIIIHFIIFRSSNTWKSVAHH